MDDSFYIHVKRGAHGGFSITEIFENNDQSLAFGGNVKDATEYFGKRLTDLASQPEVSKVPSETSRKSPFESIPKPRVVASQRALADRLIERDFEQHYADASQM